MRIEATNLNKIIEEKYTWEYLFKGLTFFVIGNTLVWYKFGRIMTKLFMAVGKFTFDMIKKQGEKHEKNKTK
jgi:hypothetical protein